MTESQALLALAALLKSGLSVRQALSAWSDELNGDMRTEAREVARRLELGHSTLSAVEVSSVAWVLLPALSVHFSTGADLVAWLERVAADREATVAGAKAARGAAAGAALSGRMVAGLPLLFIPLTPVARAPLTDPIGVVMLGVGLGLAITGLRWIGRLLPRPPEADPVAELCMSMAAMLRAGLSIYRALETASAQRSSPEWLLQARQRVQLGWSWADALAADGEDEGAALATAIRRGQRFGVPLAGVLEGLARARRAEQRRRFEEKMKRAPVLMVVPLTCCILPAYALLALGPFLRSMSTG